MPSDYGEDNSKSRAPSLSWKFTLYCFAFENPGSRYLAALSNFGGFCDPKPFKIWHGLLVSKGSHVEFWRFCDPKPLNISHCLHLFNKCNFIWLKTCAAVDPQYNAGCHNAGCHNAGFTMQESCIFTWCMLRTALQNVLIAFPFRIIQSNEKQCNPQQWKAVQRNTQQCKATTRNAKQRKALQSITR